MGLIGFRILCLFPPLCLPGGPELWGIIFVVLGFLIGMSIPYNMAEASHKKKVRAKGGVGRTATTGPTPLAGRTREE